MLNSLLILLSVIAGYSMSVRSARPHESEDWLACPLICLGAIIFSIASVSFSQADDLRRPSMNRQPLDWRYDPLQSLCITTFISLAWAIGAALSLFSVGANALIVFSMFMSSVIGLSLGQLTIYKIYRRRIVAGED